MKDGVTYHCDFCNAEALAADVDTGKVPWSWGNQGMVMGFGASGTIRNIQKHACGNNVCYCKLVSWAHS